MLLEVSEFWAIGLLSSYPNLRLFLLRAILPMWFTFVAGPDV